MKRKNPDTGYEFKYGEVREDGYIFRAYNKKKLKSDGFYSEYWHSAKVFVEQAEAQKTLAKIWRGKRYNERRTFMDNYKLERGCELCGYNKHAVALDMDHINPKDKKFDIAKRLGLASNERLMNELSKCRVLCANCHRVHSHTEGHSDSGIYNKEGKRMALIKKIKEELL